MEPRWSSRTRLILKTSANSSRLQQLDLLIFNLAHKYARSPGVIAKAVIRYGRGNRPLRLVGPPSELLLFLTGREADIGITAEPETVEEFRKAVPALRGVPVAGGARRRPARLRRRRRPPPEIGRAHV